MRTWAALALTVAVVPAGGPVAREPSGSGYAAVEAYLEQHQASQRIPGLVAAIVRGDRAVYRYVSGVDGDGDPVTSRTPFLLGSVAKPFTALTVMQLVEAGQVSLDTAVRQYLPWLRLADDVAAQRITVRQLLTHTSGLPGVATRGLTDRFDNTPDGLARSVRDLATVAPTAAPGARHQYSDANYQILGVMVEAVTGQPFGDRLRQAVLDPLSMSHSAATQAEAVAIGLPPGHRSWFGHPRRFGAPFDTSGVPYGYLAASLDDLTHFVAAELGGGSYGGARILSPQGIAATQAGQPGTGGSGRYGLGWRDTTLDGVGTRIVWHAGATPGYFAHLLLAPDSRLGVILLSNVYSPVRDAALAAAAFDITRILHGAPPRPAPADQAFTAVLVVLLVVAGLLLAGIGWSLVRAGRGHTRSAEPATGRAVASGAGWLLGSAMLATGAAWALPKAWDGAGLAQVVLWAPDIGYAMVAVTVLAAILGLLRAALAGHAVARHRHRPPSADQPPLSTNPRGTLETAS